MNFLLFSFALLLSLNAVSAAHIARSHQHRALSARRAAAEANGPLQLQNLGRRCKPRPKQGNTTHTSSTPPAYEKPTSYPSSSAPPAYEKPTSYPPSSAPSPPSSSSSSPPPATMTPKKEPSPSPQNNAVNTDTTPTPAPTSTPQPSPTQNPAGSSETFDGKATFYDTGLGACGWTNKGADPICAISHELFDTLPNGGNTNNSPFCGKKIEITYQVGPVTHTNTVTVVDRCEGCKFYDLDLSRSAFGQFAPESVGLFYMKWKWV